MRGGELLEKLKEDGSLSERETATIMLTIFQTVELLHRNSIGESRSFCFRKKINHRPTQTDKNRTARSQVRASLEKTSSRFTERRE